MSASTIGSSSSIIRAIFRAMLSAVIAVSLFTISCGDDGGEDTPVGGCDISKWGGGLVLPSGCAWTDAHLYSVGMRDGLIFNANGTGYWVSDYDDDTWIIEETGTYTVSGNTVTATYDGGLNISSTYSIVGNKLRLPNLAQMWMGTEYVITSNVTIGSSSTNSVVVNVGGGNDDDDDDGGDPPELTGGDLTSGESDMWVLCEIEYGFESCMGFAFRNGTIYIGSEIMSSLWFHDVAGTYTTDGNIININFDYMGEVENVSATYGVSDNQLILDYGDGYVDVYTKRTGLTFVTLEEICQEYIDMDLFDTIDECEDFILSGGDDEPFFKRHENIGIRLNLPRQQSKKLSRLR